MGLGPGVGNLDSYGGSHWTIPGSVLEATEGCTSVGVSQNWGVPF